jgi:hypothetical protein
MIPGAWPGLLLLGLDGKNNSLTCHPHTQPKGFCLYIRITDHLCSADCQVTPSGVIAPSGPPQRFLPACSPIDLILPIFTSNHTQVYGSRTHVPVTYMGRTHLVLGMFGLFCTLLCGTFFYLTFKDHYHAAVRQSPINQLLYSGYS